MNCIPNEDNGYHDTLFLLNDGTIRSRYQTDKKYVICKRIPYYYTTIEHVPLKVGEVYEICRKSGDNFYYLYYGCSAIRIQANDIYFETISTDLWISYYEPIPQEQSWFERKILKKPIEYDYIRRYQHYDIEPLLAAKFYTSITIINKIKDSDFYIFFNEKVKFVIDTLIEVYKIGDKQKLETHIKECDEIISRIGAAIEKLELEAGLYQFELHCAKLLQEKKQKEDRLEEIVQDTKICKSNIQDIWINS